MQLTSIHRYPVKSFRGETLTAAEVEPWGLAGDRRWMVVDPDGGFITAREVNRMLLIEPTITATGLQLSGPDLPTLAVPFPDAAERIPVTVWSSSLEVPVAGADADAWLTSALGRPARLVHLDDPTLRPTNPGFSEPTDRVSFADGYPLLVTTQESLAAFNDAMLERTGGEAEPLAMTRFRPNVVVSGSPAWVEDDWRRVRIGEVVFRAVKGCARCVMTTVDPDTAERGKEPTATLARIRRWDGAVWFGTNLVPDLAPGFGADAPRPVLSVGDEVEVLESVEPGEGPIRPHSPSAAAS